MFWWKGASRGRIPFSNGEVNYSVDTAELEVVLIGSGSEVWPVIEAAKLLAAEGIAARVVSFPSWKLFEEQSPEYKASVLPAGVPGWRWKPVPHWAGGSTRAWTAT